MPILEKLQSVEKTMWVLVSPSLIRNRPTLPVSLTGYGSLAADEENMVIISQIMNNVEIRIAIWFNFTFSNENVVKALDFE